MAIDFDDTFDATFEHLMLKMRIYPVGTPDEEKDDHWCMMAADYEETVEGLGLQTRIAVPYGRSVSEFVFTETDITDATTRCNMILANRFANFKGQTWAGDVVEVGY